MDDNANYYPDGVTQVLKLLKIALGEEYTYFDDELLEIGKEQLPCVMVFEGAGGVKAGATTTDDLGETVNIIVALDIATDMGATETTQLTGNRLRHLVKGQDPVTQEWLKGTIMHTLRTQFTLGDGTVDNTVNLDFAPNVRGDNIFTKEAYITITLERIVRVPERS